MQQWHSFPNTIPYTAQIGWLVRQSTSFAHHPASMYVPAPQLRFFGSARVTHLLYGVTLSDSVYCLLGLM